MKGLMIALGGKPSKGMGDDDSGGESSSERDYAREAFSALKDDDEEGFITAFLGAVRACKGKSAPETDTDEE